MQSRDVRGFLFSPQSKPKISNLMDSFFAGGGPKIFQTPPPKILPQLTIYQLPKFSPISASPKLLDPLNFSHSCQSYNPQNFPQVLTESPFFSRSKILDPPPKFLLQLTVYQPTKFFIGFCKSPILAVPSLQTPKKHPPPYLLNSQFRKILTTPPYIQRAKPSNLYYLFFIAF